MRWKIQLNDNDKKKSKIWRKSVNDKAQQRDVEESVASEVYDSGTTSIRIMKNNEFILIDEQ